MSVIYELYLSFTKGITAVLSSEAQVRHSLVLLQDLRHSSRRVMQRTYNVFFCSANLLTSDISVSTVTRSLNSRISIIAARIAPHWPVRQGKRSPKPPLVKQRRCSQLVPRSRVQGPLLRTGSSSNRKEVFPSTLSNLPVRYIDQGFAKIDFFFSLPPHSACCPAYPAGSEPNYAAGSACVRSTFLGGAAVRSGRW